MEYKYNALDLLSKDFTDIDLNEDKHIVLSCYKINTNGLFPFLEYLLCNTNENRYVLPTMLNCVKQFNSNKIPIFAPV